MLVFGALQNDLYVSFNTYIYSQNALLLCLLAALHPYGSFLICGGRAARFGRPEGVLEQSRGVRRLGVGFGDVRSRNARLNCGLIVLDVTSVGAGEV